MRTFTILIVMLAAIGPAAARELPQNALPKDLVYLRDIDPSIAQDMRYASRDNFVGQPLPGYDAPECVLRRDAALALQKVQADLASQHLSLKTYDCYRPTRAVAAMARWAQDNRTGRDNGATKRFYPALEKRTLFAAGYIAARSAHSTGTAIDLTLIKLPAWTKPPYDTGAAYGPCTAPAAQRAPDNSLDMGTGFDCFDVKSHTSSGAITAEQKRARGLLLAAMRAHGFKNYFREWWHFTYGAQPRQAYDRKAYDVPIAPRSP